MSVMTERIASGEAIDVMTIGRRHHEQPGVYVLDKDSYTDGKDYCDRRIARWIWSIGRHHKTGEILASLDNRFLGNAEYECIWLR